MPGRNRPIRNQPIRTQPIWKTALATPAGILQAAMEAVPAVKWALGVAGVISAVALVKELFSGDWVAAMLAGLVMLVLMTFLVLFAAIARASSGRLMVPALVFTWSSLILVIACATLSASSAFFDWPKPFSDLKQIFSSSPAKPLIRPDDFFPPVKQGEPIKTWNDEFVSEKDMPRHWTPVPAGWAENRDLPDPMQRGFFIKGPGLVFSAPQNQKYYDFHFTVYFQFLQEGNGEFSWGIRLGGKLESAHGYLFNLTREVGDSGLTTISLKAYAGRSIRTDLAWTKQDLLPDDESNYIVNQNTCAPDDNAKFQVTGDVRGYQFQLHPQLDRLGSDDDPCKMPTKPKPFTFRDAKKSYPSGLFGVFARQGAGQPRVSWVQLESLVEP